ncbi:hypothetical protein NDU88_003143 [Pleurodeles waltl]|uniref:Uncharacterized protein n=1 Tax=Pleurodeles waltl TaxID=8319 RepID=A0AAV7SCY1_PLEWA|nr:hypothetical protein NDU88_003143 [Pleurodeles waltl]
MDYITTPIKNPNGTYNTTLIALLITTGCTDETEVTCSAKHETGDWSRKLKISGFEKKGKTQGISPEFLIKTGVFAAFVCIIYTIFLACKWLLDRRAL